MSAPQSFFKSLSRRLWLVVGQVHDEFVSYMSKIREPVDPIENKTPTPNKVEVDKHVAEISDEELTREALASGSVDDYQDEMTESQKDEYDNQDDEEDESNQASEEQPFGASWTANDKEVIIGDDEPVGKWGPTRILKKRQVRERWSTVIEGGHDKAETIFEMTEKYLEDSEMPQVSWERIIAQPSRTRGLLWGKKRDFILIRHKGVGDKIRLYISARAFGTYLDVAWFLTEKVGILKRIFRMFFFLYTWGGAAIKADIFDEQEIRAYTTIAHRCLQKAVDAVASELGQDTSTIDRKSKGVLEIW